MPMASATVSGRVCILACGAQYRFNRQLGLGIPRAYLQTAQLETPFPRGSRRRDRSRSHARAARVRVDRAVPSRRIVDGAHRPDGDRRASRPGSATISVRCRRATARSPLAVPSAPAGCCRSLRSSAPTRDRVLAVGDAAGLAKPTTGGGIYYSLLSGRLAAEVLVSALRAGSHRRRHAALVRIAVAVAARTRAARRAGLPHARGAVRRPRDRRAARARRGRRHRPAAAPHRQLQLAPRRRARACSRIRDSDGLCCRVSGLRLQLNPNSQLPIPKDPCPSDLAFGSWELGVGSWDALTACPADRAAASSDPS